MSETAPEDRIPFILKVVYGLGAFVNNILAAAIGGMLIVLNLDLGMSTTLVGLLGALPRVTDAITDPLMGYISDNTRSRWGRRRPYIFVGAIASGIIYALLWLLIPQGAGTGVLFAYFLIGSILFYLAYTTFATPWVALGYELTPDYHERTRLMGIQNFIGQLAYMVSPWFLAIMANPQWFESQITGAAYLATAIGVSAIALGVMPAIFLKERFTFATTTDDSSSANASSSATENKTSLSEELRKFIDGFKITLTSRPFLKLCAATFLVFNGFILISSFQTYVLIYYVYGGDEAAGANLAGLSGTIGTIANLIVIALVTYLSSRIGKRRAFFVSTGLSMLGYILKWFCYSPEYPLLALIPAPLMAFGLGGLFTLMPSMIADVVDVDELETNQRREGMFGSIFWWVVKVGMAAALAGGGILLDLTGFNVSLGGNQSETTITMMRACDAFIPAIASGLAIWAVASYGITEETALNVRKKLEERRAEEAANA
ncbi:MAG: MFS transporter [Myxococcota bacterium]